MQLHTYTHGNIHFIDNIYIVKGLDGGQAYSNPLPRLYCNVGWKMIGSIIYANSNWNDIHLIATYATRERETESQYYFISEGDMKREHKNNDVWR